MVVPGITVPLTVIVQDNRSERLLSSGIATCAGSFDEDYTLGDELGHGATSVVRSVWSRDGRGLAVKIINKKQLQSEQLEQVVVELRCLSMLRHENGHENVVRLLAVHEDESRLMLVMERAKCDLLDALSSAGLFSEARARRVMRQLLAALEHLHAHGIVHRDIKPENLLLTGSGWDERQLVLKVADFGTARLADVPTGSSPDGLIAALRAMVTGSAARTGTSYYMAPEVCWRRPYGAAVDVWSAGVVLHVLLSGEPPWGEGATPHPSAAAEVEPSFSAAAWRAVSSEGRALLGGLLAVDPARRLTAPAALAAPWFGASLPDAAPLPCLSKREPAAAELPSQAGGTASPSSIVEAELGSGAAAEARAEEPAAQPLPVTDPRRCFPEFAPSACFPEFPPLTCCAQRKAGGAKRMRVERSSREERHSREERTSRDRDERMSAMSDD